jgi:alpha-glucosidase
VTGTTLQLHNIIGRLVLCFLLEGLPFVASSLHAEGTGAITSIRIDGSSLIVSTSSDVVVFKACADNILMVNYRPGGIEDPDTLVVHTTNWPPVAATIDTSGTTLSLTTSKYRLEVDRSPLRFHLYSSAGTGGLRFLCEEPSGGGMSANRISVVNSGGTFYGVHNRSQGSLPTSTGGNVFAGSQGQAGGPFAWTTYGWGFLADADGGTITIASTTFTFEQPDPPSKRDLECYFFTGSPKEIFTALHRVTGFPPLFPKQTLGFMNTEWGIDQPELYGNIRTYRAKQIPIDAYILDFDWMDWGSDDYGEFRWGTKFPDGQSGTIVDTLKRYNMHLMGIRKPRVHATTIQGRYAGSHGFFVDYVTDYFSGKSVGRMNFQLPEARQWYWQSFAVQYGSYGKGITGYWNDEADEYGGNLMFMQMQRAMYEGQRSFNNDRVWSINRNFYTGAQRYAYGLWSGDINTGFGTMAAQRLFMLSSVALGASWWSMDVGGFNGTPSPENYYRWIQFGAFVPIFRVHGTQNEEREPWNYGVLAESLAIKAIRLRYQLMPYIYSAAWENHLTGLPMARPLVMDYPGEPAVLDLSTEWMFGNDLLVSPVVQSGVTQQSVYLPAGTWYDFATGQQYAGGTTSQVPVTSDHIPVFVKAGAIIPMSPPAQFADAPEMQRAVILSSWPGGSGQCTIYDDDGTTYSYEAGDVSTTSIRHTRNDARALVSIGPRTGPFHPARRDWLCNFRWVSRMPDSVTVDGSHVPQHAADSLAADTLCGWGYDASAQQCVVRQPDDGQPHEVAVHFNATSSGMRTSPEVPRSSSLGLNYPNPFNPTTNIRYQISDIGNLKLAVYDLLGQEVAVLVNGRMDAGTYDATWDARACASGIYICRMMAGSYVQSIKMAFIR